MELLELLTDSGSDIVCANRNALINQLLIRRMRHVIQFADQVFAKNIANIVCDYYVDIQI